MPSQIMLDIHKDRQHKFLTKTIISTTSENYLLLVAWTVFYDKEYTEQIFMYLPLFICYASASTLMCTLQIEIYRRNNANTNCKHHITRELSQVKSGFA